MSGDDAMRLDRAVGVLLCAAAGDALGVHYEPAGRAIELGTARMLGGGYGGCARGEWSDDTQMACVIAKVAATGADLRSREALDEIARGFVGWYRWGPPDIGIQTRAVLGAVGDEPTGAALNAAAAEVANRSERSAGNGSLMRTGPVALAHLGDPAAIADAARAISDLTHADPSAGDACVLWCLAIDHTVRTGELDIRVGLPYVDDGWAEQLEQATHAAPSDYARSNGWVVHALLGAWAAVCKSTSLEDGLQAAVCAGGDTDTVAAIAGALLGARFGGSAVPARWRRILHGWPGLRSRDLVALAVLAAQNGKPDGAGWPTGAGLPNYPRTGRTPVPHPDDDGVLLGDVASLRPGVADAVVSLCRLGAKQAPLEGIAPQDHVEVWLVDDDNANLDTTSVLRDTAEVIRELREKGKTVFLHCVHAHCRTPVVAAAYGWLRTGTDPDVVLARVVAALGRTAVRPSIAAGLRGLVEA